MPQYLTLTSEQRAAFERDGLLRLPGFYPAAEIALMADRLWADLGQRYGMMRDRPETWTTARPAQFQAVEKAGAFDGLGSPALRELADALLGAGLWRVPTRWGQPLVTMPAPRWDMPRVMWHLDYPARDRPARLGAIRMFVFLETVETRGGGTLCVAGSHRVAMAIAGREGGSVRSAEMRERLKVAHPWFARLWATPGDEVRGLLGDRATVDGVEVRVEELTGEPGDVVVMHPNMLHGASFNAMPRPRMMLVQSLGR